MLIHEEQIYVACLGDSLAVMGSAKGPSWEANRLAEILSPSDAAERARIEAAGGCVVEEFLAACLRVHMLPCSPVYTFTCLHVHLFTF